MAMSELWIVDKNGITQHEIKTEVKHHKGRKLPKILSRDDIAKLFKAINTKCPSGLRNYVAYLLMYRCGLRKAEVINLNLKDIDLIEGRIFVQQGKGNKDRYTMMDEQTIEWCNKWLAIRPSNAERFLTTLQGGEIHPRYFNQNLERLSKKSGVYIQDGNELKPMHCHVFRHCFATELIEEGYNIIEVQNLLGHSSVNTTQVYAHCRNMELSKKIKNRKSILL